ncbi:MAG: hypothetical protein P1Q69_18525, partial [Candidatus Thorarchaeota archaeon]|nr:hypothetical protein [Candidatus Thorarchaeota archaeon]
MTEKGTERAARVADLMQTLARLLVLVIIIPAAILLAVYFLLAGLIPDVVIRGMFSLTFGFGLAGGFVARMKHPLLGSSIVTLATILGATSLALFWNSLFAAALVFHIFSIVLLGIMNYLHRVNVIPPWRWSWMKSMNAAIIVASAPIAFAILLSSLGFLPTHVIALSSLILWIYSVGAQYYSRNLRLGLVNSTIPSLAVSMIVLQSFIDGYPTSDILLLSSIGMLGFGTGLLVITQITRFIQRSLSLRPVRMESEKLRRAQILKEVGLDNYADEVLETIEPKPEWLINTKQAQSLSGLSLLFIAAGIPTYFLWMSLHTPLGIEAAFNLLFFPLAALISLIVLIPSPVLFRLGGAIERSREIIVAKGLGLIVVLDAALISIIWTQFFYWGIFQTVALAFSLFLTGITGVSERIRRIWRNLGHIVTDLLHRIHLWISSHMLHTGIAIDFAITALVLYLAYPVLSTLPNSMISLPTLSALVFTVIALIGVGIYGSLERRNAFAAIGWGTLLFSSSLLTFWYLSSILMLNLFSAACYGVIWWIGFAALQKISISRRHVSVPFI